MNQVKCYIDGACPDNPGPIGSWGFLITDPWIEKSGVIRGQITSNVAEFTALIELLKELDMLMIEKAIIHSDSKLVVNIVNGRWKARKRHLKELAGEIQMGPHKLVWIPREENHTADAIASEALETT